MEPIELDLASTSDKETVMLQPEVKHAFDIISSIFSFACTLLYIRASVYAWPIGLIAISIDCFLYSQTGIYGDMSLEVFYFVSTLYGWYAWAHGGNQKTPLPISHIHWQHVRKLIFIALIGIALTAYFLIHDTNSKIPYLDSSTTILSIIAQWLICRKKIENWILWFFIDATYSALFIIKGLPAHSILHIIYCGMAVVGYWHWYRLMKKNQTQSCGLRKCSTKRASGVFGSG